MEPSAGHASYLPPGDWLTSKRGWSRNADEINTST